MIAFRALDGLQSRKRMRFWMAPYGLCLVQMYLSGITHFDLNEFVDFSLLEKKAPDSFESMAFYVAAEVSSAEGGDSARRRGHGNQGCEQEFTHIKSRCRTRGACSVTYGQR